MAPSRYRSRAKWWAASAGTPAPRRSGRACAGWYLVRPPGVHGFPGRVAAPPARQMPPIRTRTAPGGAESGTSWRLAWRTRFDRYTLALPHRARHLAYDDGMKQTGEHAARERCSPEQPKLVERPATHDDCEPGRARRVHRRVRHR